MNDLKLDEYVSFGVGYNSPSITFMTFALCMLCMTFGVFTLLEKIKYLKKASLFACKIGQHSLYIFLYDNLFLGCFLGKYMIGLPGRNRWLARIVFLY